MNKGLDFLRGKYGAGKGGIVLKGGHCFVGSTPLLPGRMERKIVELKKMTENGTLEGVSTLRFASFAPKGADIEAMLAKELDLAAYLGASDVVRVMAVASGNAVNVLAKLANDVNVSIEIGAGLPKGATGYDRHEIIAKRGVACDQTVDTHTLRRDLERPCGIRAPAAARRREGMEGRLDEGDEGRGARVRRGQVQGREGNQAPQGH